MRRRVESYGTIIVDLAERAQARLDDGATVDVAGEVAQLTLAIAAKTLFDSNVDCAADQIGPWMTRAGRQRRARRQLDERVQQRIDACRAAGVDVGDLLSAMVAAGWSDAQIRGEAIALLGEARLRTNEALVSSFETLARQPGIGDGRTHRFDEALRRVGGVPASELGHSFALLQGRLILATWTWRLALVPFDDGPPGGWRVARR